jgi:serine/threonine protein kinase
VSPAKAKPKARGNPRLRRKPPLRKGGELAPGYRVTEHLSRNRYLDVYEVWSEERRCRCIAKLNRPHLAAEPYDRRKLLEEAWLLLRLEHLHIVRAYELIKDPEPILILEILNGETLGYTVEESPRRLPATALTYIGIHLCSAMSYLHGKGYLHLDLKPDNVIIDAGMSKVIDLSVARRPGRHKGGIGTPDFMSPEQAGGGMLTTACDVWGIGAVLFEVATFTPAFVCPSRKEYPQLTERAPQISKRRRGLPPEFSELVMACLEPAPGDRPGIDELMSGLGKLVPGEVPFAPDGRARRPGAKPARKA